MLLLGRIPDVIMTACCLHNFIIQVGEADDEEPFEEEEPENDEDEEVFGDAMEDYPGNAAAKRKRNQLNIFYNDFHGICSLSENTG